MVAIFVAGGESLVPSAETLGRIAKCGQVLGAQALDLRIGPLRGVVITTFVQGLATSSMRANVMVHIPKGSELETELAALYGKLARCVHIERVKFEYDDRTRNELWNSDYVLVLPGEEHTSLEMGRAIDIRSIKRVFVLDGEGDQTAEAAKWSFSRKIRIVRGVDEVLSYLQAQDKTRQPDRPGQPATPRSITAGG